MELPRLATVCLVVATALAETVNFWASMVICACESAAATRAGGEDGRRRRTLRRVRGCVLGVFRPIREHKS